MDTLTAIGTYRQRNGLRPLAEAARDQAALLRQVHAPLPPRNAREAKRADFAARVAAKVAAVPATVTRPAPATVQVAAQRRSHAEVQAVAANVPDGRYALPRREASSAGNTVTFFQVKTLRNGRKVIDQLIGAPRTWRKQALASTNMEYYAFLHIGNDLMASIALFGEKTVTCSRCGSPLSDETSRARGLGPDCVKHY